MRAAQGEPIAIAPTAMKYLMDSYNLVMTAAGTVEIYGLTVDMSLNKDHHLFCRQRQIDKVAKNAGINPSDDDPGVILNTTKGDFSSAQVTQYFVESNDLKGAIISSSNFEPLPIAISAERTTVPLAHVAHNSV